MHKRVRDLNITVNFLVANIFVISKHATIITDTSTAFMVK
jgi:hypothetical protein